MLRADARDSHVSLPFAAVRTLLGLTLVVGMVTGFALFSIFLPRWRTGHEKIPLVRGVVVPTAAQRRTGPLAIGLELYQGRPRRVQASDTPIDDDGPEPEERGRFELAAGPEDGATFFVRASVELPTFDVFCADIALPRVRVVDGTWVGVGSGSPLAPLRITPTSKC